MQLKGLGAALQKSYSEGPPHMELLWYNVSVSKLRGTFILSRIGMWLWMGFRLVIGFIELFDTARDYTLQFTVTHISVHSQSLYCRCLVAAFNGGRSPSSGFPNCPRPQLPASKSKSTQQLKPNSPLTATQSQSQSQSQSFFTTDGLQSINSSWRQVPWGSLPETFVSFATEPLQS
jgi:hypothetical protein